MTTSCADMGDDHHRDVRSILPARKNGGECNLRVCRIFRLRSARATIKIRLEALISFLRCDLRCAFGTLPLEVNSLMAMLRYACYPKSYSASAPFLYVNSSAVTRNTSLCSLRGSAVNTSLLISIAASLSAGTFIHIIGPLTCETSKISYLINAAGDTIHRLLYSIAYNTSAT